MLISEAYREQNRLLHEQRDDYGRLGQRWAPYIDRLIDEEGFVTTLDWGCGKGTLAEQLRFRGKMIAEFDPAIPGKDATPEPAELVVCTDVLEHIEPVHLNAVIRELRRVTMRKLFVNIATRPAGKTLPDGRNAHLIVQPPDWWRAKLASEFEVLTWEERPGMVYGECAPKGMFRRPAKRRKMTPEMAAQIDIWLREINQFADAFSVMRNARMYESVDDEPADLIVAVSILEQMPDVARALREIVQLSRKATIICIELDACRDEAWWKRLLEKRFRIAAWHVGARDLGSGEVTHVIMIGAPMINVQGVVATGAVDAEKRWEQVKAAIARFPRRIEPAPAHGRRAIVACYGPSLKDTIELLRKEAQERDAVVVSVSGAHDFLLEHGIVPTYHVECDPRPHKADNIAKGHASVQYLLASTVHEVVFNKLEGCAIRLWHVSTPEHAIPLITELGENREHVISGGGSVGLRSIPLLYAMGYRDMSIYAMDCSFKSEGETIQQWAGKHAGKRQDCCQVDCNGRIFISSPVLMTYATNFFEMVQKVEDLEVRLYGDGLLQAMARYYMGAPQLANGETADGGAGG